MKRFFTLLIGLFLIVGCGKDDNSTTPTNAADDINALVKSAGQLPDQPQSWARTTLTSFSENKVENGQNYISQSNKISLTNKFDELIAFSSTYADVLYPGSIIQGKDLLDGKLTSIGDLPRSPMTITIQGGNSQQVDNPSLSTITTAIKGIIGQTKVPAQMDYRLCELFSSNQAFLELGLNANWLVGSVA